MSEIHSATIDDMAGAVMKTIAVRRRLDHDDGGGLSAPAKKSRCDEKHMSQTPRRPKRSE